MPSLKELYKSQVKLAEEQKKLLDEYKEASQKIASAKVESDFKKLQSKKEQLSKSLKDKHAEIEKAKEKVIDLRQTLEQVLHQGSKAPKYSDAQKEFKEYEERIAKEFKEKNEEYKKQRDRLTGILHDILKDNEQKDMQKTLASVKVSSEKSQTGVENSTIASLAIKFAATHPIMIVKLAMSREFLTQEIDKMADIVRGNKEIDPQNPPRLLELAQDPEVRKLFTQDREQIQKFFKEIIPQLTPIAISQLTKIDAIESEMSKKSHEISKYPSDIRKLEGLKKDNADGKHDETIAMLKADIAPVANLLMRHQAAKTIQALQKEGYSTEYINSKLLPILTAPVELYLTNHKYLESLAKDFQIYSKAKTDKEKATFVQALVGNLPLAEIIQQSRLGALLENDHQSLAIIAKRIIESNPALLASMAENNLTPDFVSDSINHFAKTISHSLTHADLLKELTVKASLLSRLKDANSATTPEELAAITSHNDAIVAGVMVSTNKILSQSAALSLAIKELPQFLQKHEQECAALLTQNIPSMARNALREATKIGAKFGLTEEESLKKYASPAMRVLNQMSPEFLGKLSTSATSTLTLALNHLKPEELNQLSSNIKDMMHFEAGSKEHTAAKEKLQLLIQKTIIQNAPVLDKVMSEVKSLLSDDKAMSELTSTIEHAADIYLPENIRKNIDNKALANLTTMFRETSLRLISDEGFSAKQLKEAYDKYQDTKEPEHLLKLARPFVRAITPALEKNLPAFINQHQQGLLGLVENSCRNPEIAKQLQEKGLTPEFAVKTTKAAIPLVAETMPHIATIVKDLGKKSKNVDQLFKLYTNVEKASSKEKPARVIELLNHTYTMAKEHPEAYKALSKEIPDLIVKHSEPLGEAIDEFLNKTEAGQKYNIKGSELLQVAGKNIPEFVEVADLYNKKEYGKMIRKAIPLLCKKEVFAFAVKAYFTRKKTEVKKSISENKHLQQAKSFGKNVGAHLHKEQRENHKPRAHAARKDESKSIS